MSLTFLTRVLLEVCRRHFCHVWKLRSWKEVPQFTCKEKSNNTISFIDISVTRIKNELYTSLYHKKTFGFLHLGQGKGLIHSFLFCAYDKCANYVTLHNKIEFLKSIWRKNFFASFFIDNCINEIYLAQHKGKKKSFHLLRISNGNFCSN